jgi:hypothetical protein
MYEETFTAIVDSPPTRDGLISMCRQVDPPTQERIVLGAQRRIQTEKHIDNQCCPTSSTCTTGERRNTDFCPVYFTARQRSTQSASRFTKLAFHSPPSAHSSSTAKTRSSLSLLCAATLRSSTTPMRPMFRQSWKQTRRLSMPPCPSKSMNCWPNRGKLSLPSEKIVIYQHHSAIFSSSAEVGFFEDVSSTSGSGGKPFSK